MAKIKEKRIDITNWEYLKTKDKYAIVFKISNLELERRERIQKRCKSGFLKSQGLLIDEIVELNEDLYIKNYYGSDDLNENKSLIKFIQKGIVPGRLDPEKIEIEMDLCDIEHDLYLRIFHASKSVEELKKYYNGLLEHIEEIRKEI